MFEPIPDNACSDIISVDGLSWLHVHAADASDACNYRCLVTGVDGGSSGWAQTHGPTMATLYLSIDEDQIGDTDRKHKTEQVGYVVFQTTVLYPP